MKTLMLQSFRLKNFKAVRDSGTIRFTPLTVFIGNNGSGKSSIVEGLETFQAIVEEGLDKAMQQWRGFEHIWYKGVPRKLQEVKVARPCYTDPLRFELRGRVSDSPFTATMQINIGSGGNEIFIQHEELKVRNYPRLTRDTPETVKMQQGGKLPRQFPFPERRSIFWRNLDDFIAQWQFVSLIAQTMGSPTPQKRTGGPIRLAKDGSNIAEYLLSIRKLDKAPSTVL